MYTFWLKSRCTHMYAYNWIKSRCTHKYANGLKWTNILPALFQILRKTLSQRFSIGFKIFSKINASLLRTTAYRAGWRCCSDPRGFRLETRLSWLLLATSRKQHPTRIWGRTPLLERAGKRRTRSSQTGVRWLWSWIIWGQRFHSLDCIIGISPYNDWKAERNNCTVNETY